MIKAFYSGKKKIFELKTRTGRSIKASGNHPFLKLEGWTALEQLQKGDRIGIARHIQAPQVNGKMSHHELALLAHLLGDGCILPDQPYHYTSADQENINTVVQTASLLFGITPRVVQQKNWFHVYFPSPTHTTHGKKNPITDWFADLGIDRVRSYEKKIPLAVFENPEEKIAHFLKHLWATDGNISLKKLQGRKDSAAIYYASSSHTLCLQTQQLLLRLGIQSSLSTVPSKKGYRNMYHLLINGATNQQQFLTKIGCAGKRGDIIPLLLEKIQAIKPNPNADVIPKEAWGSAVRQAKEERQIGWRQVCAGIHTSYCGSSLFKTGVSRLRMQSLCEFLQSPALSKLAHSDVFWDEITSITELGIEDVYDATVEDVHNFLANDLIVHNSIEQDSDVVMFLLRREYYDPYDKPGLAELIVAKNRHGAVGSVNMTYRKELAQFSNYSPLGGSSTPDNDEAFAAFSP